MRSGARATRVGWSTGVGSIDTDAPARRRPVMLRLLIGHHAVSFSFFFFFFGGGCSCLNSWTFERQKTWLPINPILGGKGKDKGRKIAFTADVKTHVHMQWSKYMSILNLITSYIMRQRGCKTHVKQIRNK